MNDPYILVLKRHFSFFTGGPKAADYKQALKIVTKTLESIYPDDTFEINTYYHRERPTHGIFTPTDEAPRLMDEKGFFAHTMLTYFDSSAYDKAGFVATLIERKPSPTNGTNSPQWFYIYAKGSAPDQLYFESSRFEPRVYLSIFSELKDHFKQWPELKKYWANHSLRPSVF